MKVSCTVSSISTMEDKTYEELMEVQMTGNRPTFKKPISCSKCGKSFMSNNKLKTQERIHTGEKPFSCTHCNYEFANEVRLKEHEIIHTDENLLVAHIVTRNLQMKCI